MKVLSQTFLSQPTLDLAKNLLGTILCHYTNEGLLAGRIVETEAYLNDDPACHAHKGRTKRNESMFHPPGISYVYFIYGMYHCFNVVSGPKGQGEAVLIRALEPLYGTELMKQYRSCENLSKLTNGPGKLCQAMNITTTHDRLCLRTSNLRLSKDATTNKLHKNKFSQTSIICSRRIGISLGSELPYRFYLADSEFVSRKDL